MYLIVRQILSEFAADETGAMAIEYALIAAGLSVAFITLAGQNGDDVRHIIDGLRTALAMINMRFSL